ncbi:hypothetical protein C8P66_1505 [Humitalea rosea]|uniref:Type I restriction enzyme R protein N-terminal domain-containing protein n=2 Tax=Humitalea rosea TaxID=990373 RepID=A0A2W7HTQ5_9PROT|nr:hypothetical protein C8P66_1505 [Humitalea rosea]
MSRISTPPGAAGPGPLHAALRQVAASIARLRADGGQVLEEDTKRILITPTIEALGWDHIAEIRNQYRHNRRDNPVDYALFLNRSPVLYVEAKPLGGSLDDRKWIVQTLNYANAAGVDWCVLTNGAESRRRMQSTDDLFALGRLAAGTTLTIRGREDFAAWVLDGQTVEFKGERLSFNDWGQRVTGWTSIRIYTMACLPDGRTLDQFRDKAEAASTTP